MKKFVLGMTLAVCTAAICVSVAACGGGGSASEAKGVESIEVTQAQWEAAIDYIDDDDSTFAISSTSKQEMNAYGETVTMTTTITARRKDGKDYVKTTMSGGGYSDSDERYTGTEGSTKYLFSKDENGAWTKDETGSSNSIIDTGILPFYSFRYEDFTYSAEDKGYVSDSSMMPQVLKFGEVDGEVRLIALYTYVENANGKLEASYMISYSGVSDVKLPEVA